MELSCDMRNDVVLIGVHANRIDAGIALQFITKMAEATKGKTGRILMDLAEVEFIDSSGLGAVVAALKQVDKGASLELANLSVAVRKLFSLTKMDTVFRVHPSVEDALQAGSAAA
ncbi:STAS domain-containing protein [Alphaproteobacteria bacterium KMM 3653]|uniref:Anti-sigma factor antagonist n=1 Tax=Harenicola maris TaxID=2841044 RepID=A0AAP2G8W9_9RHOB|nr:STAS domain-containing protein [Harenicola maris]